MKHIPLTPVEPGKHYVCYRTHPLAFKCPECKLEWVDFNVPSNVEIRPDGEAIHQWYRK